MPASSCHPLAALAQIRKAMRGLVKEGKIANPRDVAARMRMELGIAELEERANSGVRQLAVASAAVAAPHPAGAQASQDLPDGDTVSTAIALRLSTLAITGSTRSRDIKALVPSVKALPSATRPSVGAPTFFAATPADSDSAADDTASAGPVDLPAGISREDQGGDEPGVIRSTASASGIAGQISTAGLHGPIPLPGSSPSTAPRQAILSSASAHAAATAQVKNPPPQPDVASGTKGELAGYMDQDGSVALDEVVAEMISMAYFFQERRRGDESKGKAGGVKRRIIVGMREVLRDCRAAKFKVVIICRNLEGSGGDAEGGTGSALATEVRGEVPSSKAS